MASDEWISVKQKLPSASGRYKILLDDIGIRYGDFDMFSGTWSTSGKVVSWKDIDSSLDSTPGPRLSGGLREINDFSSEGMKAVVSLAENEIRRKIGNVEVFVTVYEVEDDANVTIGGKVLAISEQYAAQQTGGDSIVVHELDRLSSRVMPGELVTMDYKDGLAQVYKGIADTYEIRITSDDLMNDEKEVIEGIIREMAGTKISMLSTEGVELVVNAAIMKAKRDLGWDDLPEDISVKQVRMIEEQAKALSSSRDHKQEHRKGI